MDGGELAVLRGCEVEGGDADPMVRVGIARVANGPAQSAVVACRWDQLEHLPNWQKSALDPEAGWRLGVRITRQEWHEWISGDDRPLVVVGACGRM